MSSLLETSHPSPLTSDDPSSSTSSIHPTPSPIPTFSIRRSVSGIDTSLLIQSFDDRILVVLTQNGKVGCLIQASLPSVVPLPHPPPAANGSSLNLPPPPDSVLLTPLLGTPPDQTLYHLYTSQIATLVWWALQEVGAPRRGVVIGLALDRRRGVGSVDDQLDEEEGDVLDLTERQRFESVMGMIAAWPGPTG